MLKNIVLPVKVLINMIVSRVPKYILNCLTRKRLRLPCVVLICICSVIYIPKFLVYKKEVNITEESLSDPNFITISYTLGRLGNQMGTYATLYGLAQLNNRTPYGFHFVIEYLRPYFHITAGEIYYIPETMKRIHELKTYLHDDDYHIPKDKNFLGGYSYPYSFTFFHHVRDKIKKEFRFREHIVEYAQNILLHYKLSHSSPLFIGVHVRRTDYCSWLYHYVGREVDPGYIKKAMSYYKKKYKKVLFVVVSDDRNWCQKHLGNLSDVVITPEPSDAIYDLATLALCNHTIMTYGTFGFWGAYLSGGETVYFADYLSPNSTFLTEEVPYDKTYLPEWIGIPSPNPVDWKTFNVSSNLC